MRFANLDGRLALSELAGPDDLAPGCELDGGRRPR
jgi:hypothetical protein